MDVRPQIPDKKGPQDIDESSDTYDTIDWLVKNVPNNNGRVGIWGISYPGFYAAAAMIDAHPALKAASPQAPLVDWFLGDDFHHNGAFFLVQCFNFYADFGVPRPEPTSKMAPRFEHGTPDAYDFFLRMGPLPRADEMYFNGQRAVLARGDGPRQLRRLLEEACPLAPLQGHQAGRADRRRLVRRRGPVRALEDVSDDRGKRARVAEHARHGPLGPRRLERWRRRLARRSQVRVEDGRVLPGTDPVPLLRASPQRRARGHLERRETDRRVDLRDRARTSGTGTTPGPRKAPGRRSLYPPRRRQARLRSARADRLGRVRRVPQRPRQARALHPGDRPELSALVHGRGPALRLATSGRARLRDRAPDRRSPRRRPDRGQAPRLDHGDAIPTGSSS